MKGRTATKSRKMITKRILRSRTGSIREMIKIPSLTAVKDESQPENVLPLKNVPEPTF
jgi:hypothetical protein